MKLITVGIKMLDVLGVFCNYLQGKKKESIVLQSQPVAVDLFK